MIKLDWSLVDKSGPCWLWLGGVNGDGYGYYKQKRVNRLVLEEILGRKLKGLALHSCRNRRCCNPNHLREGTHRDNMADMHRDGTHDGKNRRGEKHPRSKLSDSQRVSIRNSKSPGVVLAHKYKVSSGLISMIRSGKRGKIG